jgi:hypothetical protein
MAIPASQIVQINPRVLLPGGVDLQINGLLLSQNPLIPTNPIVLEFASAASVGAYFGMDSTEYRLALVYFLGYQNSFRKPRVLMIAKRVSTPVAAWLRGGAYTDTLATLKGVTNGALTISVNDTDVSVSDLSFASANSFSDVAVILQTALSAAASGTTVTYSSVTKAFQITSPTTGAGSTISFASSSGGLNLAALLNLTEQKGAVISQGADALNTAANMAAIRAVTDNWVTFTTTWEEDAAGILEYARWASGMGVEYLYLPWSTDATLLQQGSTASPADALIEANVGSTALQYGTAEYSVFYMGCAASIDWDRLNGVITFAFKRQSGLPANVTEETDALTLLNKKVNFHGNYATRNDNFIFEYQGAMYGDYKFIDPYVNAVWLNNALQVSIMNGLVQSPRTPYNDAGYAKIEAWLMDPVIRARRNGVIDAGVTLSESQKAELISEAGRDITEELFTNGYVIQIEDPGAQVRVTRDSPTISLWYCYAGSVHRIVVASTAIL